MFIKLTKFKLLVCVIGITLLNYSCSKKPDDLIVIPVISPPLTTLTGIYPKEAGFGDSVILFGENIFIENIKPVITINGINLDIIKVSKDIALFAVPKMVGSGKIRVELNNKIYDNLEFLYRYKAIVTTIAGNGLVGKADGSALTASFNCPWGLALNSAGDIYVADSYNRSIRKISTINNSVSTIIIPYLSDVFGSPYNLTVGNNQNEIYVTDFNSSILKITTENTFKHIYIGNSTTTGIAMHKDGYLYFSDNTLGTIMKMTGEGKDISIFAKGLITPRNLFFDKGENLYVPAYDGILKNPVVHKIDGSGKITNILLNKNFSGWEVVIDELGNLYVADHIKNNITIIEKNGRSSILAGSGLAKDIDGIGTGASLDGPTGLVIDKNGILYFSTYNFEQKTGNKIRKVIIE